MPSAVGKYHYLAVFTAFATFVLLVAGALVTSTGSGLSVPDWPLSYGTWNPPMVGGIAYEHSHRVLASVTGLLTVILTVWVCAAESRRWVRTLMLWALAAVVLQGILGGMTVLHQLPKLLSIAHGCLGPTFFCLMVALAVVTSAAWQRPLDQAVARQASDASSQTARLKRLAVKTVAAVYLQMVFGAMIRHTGSMHVLITHVVWALVVAVHVVLLLLKVTQRQAAFHALIRTMNAMVLLVGVQLVLGFGAYVTRWSGQASAESHGLMLASTVGHVVCGSLILALSIVVAMMVSKASGGVSVQAGEQASGR